MSDNAEGPPHKDLIELLTHDKPAIRRIAVENVLSLTTEEEDRRLLREFDAVTQLCRIVGDLSSIAGDALKCLINLSDDPIMLNGMLKAGVVGKVMESLGGEFKHKKLAIQLLLNITRLPSGAKEVLQQGSPLQGLHIRRLIVWFLNHANADFGDAFDEAGQIFANVTQLKAARELFTDPKRGILADVMVELSSPVLARRRGVAALLKNCCFEEDRLEFLLSDELALMPSIMVQLMGRETYNDKERASLPPQVIAAMGTKDNEPDAGVRRLLFETLQVLASFRPARDAMRRIGVYHVVKKVHYFIEGADSQGKVDADAELSVDDDAAVESIINLVNFIQRDESDETAPRVEEIDMDGGEEGDASGSGDSVSAGAGGAGAGAGAGSDTAQNAVAAPADASDDEGDDVGDGDSDFGSDMDEVD